MKVNVTKDNVTIQDKCLIKVHEGEYNVNELDFTFSEDYTSDLVINAVFSIEGEKAYQMSVINNKCSIPAEVLENPGRVVFGVYAYKVIEDQLELRYSPYPDFFVVISGSYDPTAEEGQEITASQFEQYMQALQDGLNEVDETLKGVEEKGDYAKEQGDYAKEQAENVKNANEEATKIIDNFEDNVQSYTTDFNNNAETKKTDFNNNYDQKLQSFNSNVIDQITSFNENATEKTNAFNSNSEEKISEFNENAVQKTNDFNENAGTFINNISVNGIPQTIINNSVDIRIESNTIYGIERNISNNSSTSWIRTDNAVDLVANATHDGSEVQNDFDNLYPWSHIKTVNYDPVEKMITATIGDSNFKFDGSNGQVMTIIPEFYFKYWTDETKEHYQISEFAIEGFIKVPGFMIGRYPSAKTTDNKLMSASGMFPETLKTITSFRDESKLIGDNFGQMDWRYFVVQLLYLVEYADYNSQLKLGNGYTSLRINDDDKSLIAENNVNRIIIATTNANNFKVGQSISIGTKAAWNWNVAKNRLITSITDFSEGDITGKAVNFDGDPVNIAVDNVIWSTGQKSGKCDVLGMKSGCISNDGKSAVIYRGLENIFGNVWQFVDGINIKDYVVYVCYNPENYAVDKFDEDYKAVGYVNANKEGWGKTLGHDANHPLVTLTTEIDGGSSNYLSDYYYANSGNRIVRVGGTWADGTSAGLWNWFCRSDSSDTYYNIGSRLLKKTI